MPGIAPRLGDLPVPEGHRPRLRQSRKGVVADGVVGSQPLDVEPLDPGLRATLRHAEVEAVLVHELCRPLRRLDPCGGELCHDRIPKRTPNGASLGDVGREAKEACETDK